MCRAKNAIASGFPTTEFVRHRIDVRRMTLISALRFLVFPRGGQGHTVHPPALCAPLFSHSSCFQNMVFDQSLFVKDIPVDVWKNLCTEMEAIHRSVAPLNKTAVESSISELYTLPGGACPWYFYCKSPWQMNLMPSALKIALRTVDKLKLSVETARTYDQLNKSLKSLYKWSGFPCCKISDLRDGPGSRCVTHAPVELTDPMCTQILSQVSADLSAPIDSTLRNQPLASLLHQLSIDLHDQLRSIGIVVDAASIFDEMANDLQQIRVESLHVSENLLWTWPFSPGDIPRDQEIVSAGENFAIYGPQLLRCYEQVHFMRPYGRICFVCERPTKLSLDTEGRLHHESDVAALYRDGYAMYALHGVLIPQPEFILQPNFVTVDLIIETLNIELRRTLLTMYGVEKFLLDSGATEVHSDKYGILYSRYLPYDEPLVMVQVVNSTREPDGSLKDYFIRVPPTMRTAREAVAWSFGLQSDEYDPLEES